MTLTPSPFEVLQTFLDHARNPTQAELRGLLQAGVPVEAIQADPDGDGEGIGVATVERLSDGCFEFAEHEGRPALVVVARDEFGDPVDMIAFRRDGFMAPWIGAAAVLGSEQVLAPRLDGVLTIYATAWAWLRAGREGVVILDERRAANRLRDFGPFRAADVEHGLRLRDLFTPAPPSILVPAPAEARRAA